MVGCCISWSNRKTHSWCWLLQHFQKQQKDSVMIVGRLQKFQKRQKDSAIMMLASHSKSYIHLFLPSNCKSLPQNLHRKRRLCDWHMHIHTYSVWAQMRNKCMKLHIFFACVHKKKKKKWERVDTTKKMRTMRPQWERERERERERESLLTHDIIALPICLHSSCCSCPHSHHPVCKLVEQNRLWIVRLFWPRTTFVPCPCRQKLLLQNGLGLGFRV